MSEPRVLADRYEVGELLGQGGMAEVFRGRDLRIGRDVALKLLRADLARDPAFQSRFRREAQAAASLSHPSIVAVYDTGDDRFGNARVPYIVMEYVDGRTLRDVLGDEGRLAPARAMQITAEVLRALAYSHRHGIIHRDIKPGNVMLTPNGGVKVMDFGIARAITSSATMTQTAAVIGTAHYLSPEQARGDHVDARSDIYSTGCLLYELLTGAPPFTGETPVAVAYQHVREQAPRPSEVEPGLPAELDPVVLKALAKNPANRYQSADEMRADLERALAGRPVLAAPVTDETVISAPPVTEVTLRRPEPPRGRRIAAYTGLALASVAIFIVAAFLARGLFQTQSTAEVNTPDVTGHSLAEAEAILGQQGLHVGRVDSQFDQHPKGTVINQSPLPDILIRKGDGIDLTVSKGIEYVTVPPLVGLSRTDAETALRGSKLTVGQVDERANPAPAGQVLSASPEPGSSEPAGTAVDLVVSNGQVQVPSVLGYDQTGAADTLQRAGFTVAVQDVSDPTKPPEVVVAQDPAGGSYASRGSTVTITVNHAPSPSPTPSASPSESPSPGPFPPPPGGGGSPSPSATPGPFAATNRG